METEGHNNPPTEAEQFKAKIKEFDRRVEIFPDICEDNEGDASDLIRLAGNLAKEIDLHRTTIKAPHLEAGRKIDSTFKPLEHGAKMCIAPLRAKLGLFLRERERKAEEAAAEAQRIADEEEQKALDAAMEAEPDQVEDILAATEDTQIAATIATAKAKSASTAKGSPGLRSTGLRTRKTCVVTNARDLVAHYYKHEDVIELCRKMAERQLKAGVEGIPGAEIQETRVL